MCSKSILRDSAISNDDKQNYLLLVEIFGHAEFEPTNQDLTKKPKASEKENVLIKLCVAVYIHNLSPISPPSPKYPKKEDNVTFSNLHPFLLQNFQFT